MNKIKQILNKYNVSLCYIFGSQQSVGMALLKGKQVDILDAESDIDFAVRFVVSPSNSLDVYANISLDLQSLVSPFKADLLFLHEVDHLIQLEAIKGINIYSLNEKYKEKYEEEVMMMASDEYEIFKLNERDLLEAIDDGYFEFEYEADRR